MNRMIQIQKTTPKIYYKFTKDKMHLNCSISRSQERNLCLSVACPSKKWGPYCKKDCPECLNGGECHDVDGDCVCPPGFMGPHCETGLYVLNNTVCVLSLKMSVATICSHRVNTPPVHPLYHNIHIYPPH